MPGIDSYIDSSPGGNALKIADHVDYESAYAHAASTGAKVFSHRGKMYDCGGSVTKMKEGGEAGVTEETTAQGPEEKKTKTPEPATPNAQNTSTVPDITQEDSIVGAAIKQANDTVKKGYQSPNPVMSAESTAVARQKWRTAPADQDNRSGGEKARQDEMAQFLADDPNPTNAYYLALKNNPKLAAALLGVSTGLSDNLGKINTGAGLTMAAAPETAPVMAPLSAVANTIPFIAEIIKKTMGDPYSNVLGEGARAAGGILLRRTMAQSGRVGRAIASKVKGTGWKNPNAAPLKSHSFSTITGRKRVTAPAATTPATAPATAATPAATPAAPVNAKVTAKQRVIKIYDKITKETIKGKEGPSLLSKVKGRLKSKNKANN